MVIAKVHYVESPDPLKKWDQETTKKIVKEVVKNS